MIKYKPRGPLCLVRRVKVEEVKSATGIYLPTAAAEDYNLVKFEIIATGPDVYDLKPGDMVLAEDAFNALQKSDPSLGLLGEKYIHMIYGK